MTKLQKVVIAIAAAYVFAATAAVLVWYTNVAAKYAIDMAIWYGQSH